MSHICISSFIVNLMSDNVKQFKLGKRENTKALLQIAEISTAISPLPLTHTGFQATWGKAKVPNALSISPQASA